MLSIKKPFFLNFETLIVLKVFILFSITFFVESSFAAKSPIKVREFKFYREYAFDHGKVLIDKKRLTYFYIGKAGNLKSEIGALGRTSIYSKKGKKQAHYLVSVINKNKVEKIGYFASNHQIQYQDQAEICEDSTSKFSKNITQIISPDLVERIRSLEVTNLFDKDTCGNMAPDKFEKVKKTLIGTLVFKQSKMQRCFESEITRAIFLKDTALLNNANEVLGKYLALIEELGSSKLKIKCGMKEGDTNKVASFSQNPLEMSFNVVNGEFNLGIKNIRDVLNHELLHFGMQQFKDKEGSRCMDEGFVQLFENVCQYNPESDKKPEHSSQIVNSCLKGIKPTFVKLTSANKNSSGDLGGIAMASSGLENREQGRIVTETIVANINSGQASAPFEPIPDTVVQLAATEPVVTTTGQPISAFEGDGKFHQVVADSSFAKSVQQLGDGLLNSMGSADKILTSALSGAGQVAAAVAVGSRAVASSGGGASGAVLASGSAPTSNPVATSAQVFPMTTTEIFANRYYPDSSAVAAVLNDPKLDTMSYAEKEAYFRSLDPATAAIRQQQLAATQVGVGGSASGSKVDVDDIKSAAKAPVGTTPLAVRSRSVASVGGATAVDISAAEKTEKEKQEEADQKKKAAVATTTATGSESTSNRVPAAVSTDRLDNVIIQRLSSFSKVNEPAYSRVAERFRDEVFQRQLNARKIRIVGEDGRPLWTSNQNPERCFRDNKTSKELEMVECK